MGKYLRKNEKNSSWSIFMSKFAERKHSVFMIKEYQDIIEAACVRFNNVISPLDVVAWLDNFDKSDWKKALIVLSNFEFFTTNDIIREFERGLKIIIEELHSTKNIYFIPLGKVGKSGAAMMYYLKKTPTYSSHKNEMKIIDNSDFSTLSDNCNIVIVDDFAGTGRSIIGYYNEIKSHLPSNHNLYALTVAYTEKAKHNLDEEKIRLIGCEKIPVFSSRGSVFGYYPRMKAIREFCFKYGNKLYPEHKYRSKETEQHPLGFLNTQALIGFEHSIPNNTLPIMWADCKVEGIEKRWIPLFPRRGTLLIDKSKAFRQSQIYWVSLMFKLGLNENLFQVEEKYNKDTIQLVSMIYLKKKHKNPLYICQSLGINLDEYGAIIEKGVEKNLFDSKEKLTEQAIQIFEEIQKKSKFQKEIIDEKLMIEEDAIYIPKKFRGSS